MLLQTHYQLSLCAPLPDSSTSSPDDDCPAGTRLCVKTFSQRSGLEDRLLSVVPIAGDIGSGTLGQKAVELEEGVKPSEAWLLELGGGTYNGVEQKARIEMRCDTTAKEVRSSSSCCRYCHGALDEAMPPLIPPFFPPCRAFLRPFLPSHNSSSPWTSTDSRILS